VGTCAGRVDMPFTPHAGLDEEGRQSRPLAGSRTMPRRRRSRALLPVSLALWLGGVVVGFTYVIDYEFTAGAGGGSLRLPEEARPYLDIERPTLFVFIHPNCPCSRATIQELDRILAACAGEMLARVFFYRPSTAAEGWAVTDLWHSATEIPGVSTHVDARGEEALRFGAETSGHAQLYSPSGELLFSGGITGSRGHAGDNAGRKAIEDLVLHGAADRHTTPVFGCSIRAIGED